MTPQQPSGAVCGKVAVASDCSVIYLVGWQYTESLDLLGTRNGTGRDSVRTTEVLRPDNNGTRLRGQKAAGSGREVRARFPRSQELGFVGRGPFWPRSRGGLEGPEASRRLSRCCSFLGPNPSLSHVPFPSRSMFTTASMSTSTTRGTARRPKDRLPRAAIRTAGTGVEGGARPTCSALRPTV